MLTAMPAQTSTPRFTLDGSAELEQYLADLCRRIARAVLEVVQPPKLQALVLAGGYGRGQGGVLRMEDREAPYNDLEFYVFLGGNYWLNALNFNPAFRRLEETLTPEAGLHVEFKIDSLEQLRRRPVSIFSYDLVSAHRVLLGSDDVFADCELHLDGSRIDPGEATRLLLNRCSGLLLAKEFLLQDELSNDQTDFVWRNIAKAKLALGDAVLALAGRYHWDCLERARRLRWLQPAKQPPFFADVLKFHAAGVRFKLHPARENKSLGELRRVHQRVTEVAMEEWLWIENRRLKTSFSNVREYAFSRIKKCAGPALWRNVVLNIKAFGACAVFDKNAPRYPRERLLNTLPLLLSERESCTEPPTGRYLQSQLHAPAQDRAALLAAYRHIWTAYG